MSDIIHSEVFDHDDKTYLIDRLPGKMNGPVIRITETVHHGSRRGQYVVEIDGTVLKRIQELAQASVQYDATGKPTRIVKATRLTPEQMDKIVRNYLRGVPILDLALQLGCHASDIAGVLRSRDIAIVDDPLKGRDNYRGKKRRS